MRNTVMAVLEQQRMLLEERHKQLRTEREHVMSPEDAPDGDAIQLAQRLDRLDQQVDLAREATRTLDIIGKALDKALVRTKSEMAEDDPVPADWRPHV